MDQGPNIQLIDFHPFLHGSSEDRRNVASCIDEALQSAGFIYLRNHGIEQGKIDKCFTLVS
jgi:isopenicillin N synthase-like dioxygenase